MDDHFPHYLTQVPSMLMHDKNASNDSDQLKSDKLDMYPFLSGADNDTKCALLRIQCDQSKYFIKQHQGRVWSQNASMYETCHLVLIKKSKQAWMLYISKKFQADFHILFIYN